MVRAFTIKTAICLAGMQVIFVFSNSALSATVKNPPQPALTLKGSVRTDCEQTDKSCLSRSEIGNQLAGEDKPLEEIEAPTKQQMMMEPVRTPAQAPPPKRALKGKADDWGKGMLSMQPTAAPYGGEEVPLPKFPQQAPAQNQIQSNNNDPDNSPEMLLLWDIWHHRVAESIYLRFNFLAKLGFRHSPPLLCQVSYVVTRDGHIQNIQVQQKSSNALFNMIVSQCINSLDGDTSLLTFPQGSRRSFVPKMGTFTQNYGTDGFKYTTGDRETVH